jgi:amino acid transporter/nucleotide-binding universal stress UspA family protein
MTTETTDLRRELGFWAALTIGTGTMIGAGIFLLSGLAVSLTGPAAIFSYIAAGIVCVITAASAAELATGMPTSGGDYFFVSRSLGPPFGAISGIGIWLSLTFAIAFYLFGMGEYLHQFLPISPLAGAILGGVVLTGLNIIGAKESGRTQVIVVLAMLAILVGFVIFGVTLVDPDNLDPFFPYGVRPVFTTIALVFISFLGFVKIAAVSEEIKDPGKNLPRALIGSVVLVTILYVLIVLVIAGIFSQEEIVTIRSPLTVAAERLFGRAGAAVLIFAGLLATLSSANASIMAASRINLAMARDRMIPGWLSAIHPVRLTPYRAIILTGALSLAFLFIESLETLAEIASVLQLYSYAALCLGCVVLRVASPDWYKPSFRVPGTPFVQVFAALGCLAIVLVSGIIAQAIIVALIIASLSWYFLWARRQVDIRFGLPLFREKWAQQGWQVVVRPAEKYPPAAAPEAMPPVRRIDPIGPRRVVVALANPAHEADLLRLGRYLATGQSEGGVVYGVHFVTVPVQTPLDAARQEFAQRPSIERSIATLAALNHRQDSANGQSERPLSATQMVGVTDVVHDVFGSLAAETQRQQADCLLMGWQGGFNVSRIYSSPVQYILANTPADVAVLKDRGLSPLDSILIPWGGGPHAQLGLEFAVRVGEATGADIHVLRITHPQAGVASELETLESSVVSIVGDYGRIHYHLETGEEVTDALLAAIDVVDPNLVIIGASHEWRIRNFLFGSIPDLVADHARCSVLMVRRHFLMRGRGR